MIRRPRRSTPFPSTPLFQSLEPRPGDDEGDGGEHREQARDVAPADAAQEVHAPTRPRPAGFAPRCYPPRSHMAKPAPTYEDRKSTRLNSSHANISYAVFCLK